MLWLPCSMIAVPFIPALAWFWNRLWRHSTVYVSGGMSLSSMRAPSRRGGYCSLHPKSANWKKNWAQCGRCDISWKECKHVLWEFLSTRFIMWISFRLIICLPPQVNCSLPLDWVHHKDAVVSLLNCLNCYLGNSAHLSLLGTILLTATVNKSTYKICTQFPLITILSVLMSRKLILVTF